jgi:shikimate dehydrogenase
LVSIPYAEVIGDPIAHSKSPLIHNFWLKRLGIEGDYKKTHVLSPELPAFLADRRADRDWRGCNVTIPHKLAVMDLVDDPGGVRASIGAMNTVLRQPDGSLIGTNTDAAGFYAPLAETDLEGAPVAVVGTGGAAHAVLFALARASVGPVTIIARDQAKGAALLARFGLKGAARGMDAALPPVRLLVNASSLGMTGQPPFLPDLAPLPDDALVYDLVYAPLETPLFAAAAARGLTPIDGLEMLIGQAAMAFELFFGQPAPREHDAELRTLLTA